MRPLIIQAPKGNGRTILDIAEKYQGKNLVLLEGSNLETKLDIVIAYIPNREVEKLIDELQNIPELQITLFPQGVMTLYPPPESAADQATNIQPRSPIEIFLSGLQSIGSWKGFIGYSIASGIVVWIGLFTNTVFLLVAAMLIAPYAGPAMNTAIATARGDWILLRQSLVRYFAALAITILAAGLLSFILRQDIATELMVDRSQVSSVAILLALAAGAAGALNLVQSERDSLVSGAAVGMLVAASLAPPAGVIGMAIAIQRWDMALTALFVLILQLAVINLSGSIVFKLYGLTPIGPRYNRGKQKVFVGTIITTILIFGLLALLQFSWDPDLQRSSISRRAAEQVYEVVDKSNQVELVEANVRFTRSRIRGQNTLLCVIYVQKKEGITVSSEAIRNQLTWSIQQGILQEGYNITPLVDVSVLESPPRQ